MIFNRDKDLLERINFSDEQEVLKFLILQMKTGNYLKFKDIYERAGGIYSLVSQIDEKLNNLLHIACRYSSLDIVRFIVTNNPNLINTVNAYGNTPLHFAAYWGKQEVLNILMEFSEGHLATTVLNKKGYQPIDIPSASIESVLNNSSLPLKTVWVNDLKDYCLQNLPQLPASPFTDEERENFHRAIQENIITKYFQNYRDEFMPRSLLNGSLKSLVQTFWLTTSHYEQTLSWTGLNEIVGQLLYWVMVLISYFQLVSIEYLGENAYDSHPSAQIDLQGLNTNQQFHEWFFDLLTRYLNLRTFRTYEFDEIITSVMQSAKFSFGPQRNNVEVNEAAFRMSIAWKFRGVLSSRLYPLLINASNSTTEVVPLGIKGDSEEQVRPSYWFVNLIMDNRINDIIFLLNLAEYFPELKYYEKLTDFSPDLSGQTKEVNRSLLEALFGEGAISMHRNLVTEVNKFLLRLLYLRDIIRGDKKRFPRLSQKDFDELRVFILPAIDTEANLHYLFFCLIMDDLGRTSPMINIVNNFLGRSEGEKCDHDAYLKTFFERLKLHPDLLQFIPSYQRLSPIYQDLYHQQISNSFNLGAFVQGESVPYSLFQLYSSCTSPISLKYRLIVQTLAFSSFAHSDKFESLGLNDLLCQQYRLATTMILEIDTTDLSIPELQEASYRTYEKYLLERANAVKANMEELNSLPRNENFALLRIVALARASTVEQWLEIREVWTIFPSSLKTTLIEHLNRTGFANETAIYIYYAPAIIANTVTSLRNNLTPPKTPIAGAVARERTSSSLSKAPTVYMKGLFYSLQELIAIYEDGAKKVEESKSVGGVYMYHALNNAEKMKDFSTILRTIEEKPAISAYILMEGI